MMKNLVSLTLLLITCFGLLAPPPTMTEEEFILANIKESGSMIIIYTQQIAQELEKGVKADMDKVEDLRMYRTTIQKKLALQQQQYHEFIARENKGEKT